MKLTPTRQLFFALIIIYILLFNFIKNSKATKQNGAPPYLSEDLNPPNENVYSWILNWQRPDVKTRVGLQVGHWQNESLPEELSRLRGNTGSEGGGKKEWQVNYLIANKTSEILKARGVDVDILPATIPSKYWADVFVAIHADGSDDPQTSGFKIARPLKDYTGSADILISIIEEEYKKSTGFNIDPNITKNMTSYYAFSWWRYNHSLHPKTTSTIIETGFLTSAKDRKILLDSPEKSAIGIANGIIKYLENQSLLD